MPDETDSLTAEVWRLLDRKLDLGTKVVNCIAHRSISILERPKTCELCRTDANNHHDQCIRINRWLNDWVDEATRLLKAQVSRLAARDREVRELKEQLNFSERHADSITFNRNLAVEKLNEIARAIGMTGKDHFSWDAILGNTIEKMARLAEVEAAARNLVEWAKPVNVPEECYYVHREYVDRLRTVLAAHAKEGA